jgi:arylsulfatase A-like enzyme
VSRFALAGFAALSLALGGCGSRAQPDVLLVVVDTLRADRLGVYGFPAATSPVLDALAARGVVFDRAIAASAKTAPSTASLLTSRWVGRHGIGALNGTTRLDGEETLALRLRAAGYATAAFVGNVVLRRRIGLDAGFDVYDDELPDVEPNRPGFFERTAAKTTDRALAWLAGQGDRPIFLWAYYQDPHGPYTPPAPFDTYFPELADPNEAPLPLLAQDFGVGGIPAYQRFGDQRRPSEYTRRYAGEVAAFDAALGRLLAGFEQRGRPLVVAFTADHGESFGEDGYWFLHGHASTPDLSRIPFVLVAPSLSAGRRDELVHHVDVMPTLLELVGAPLPDDIDGLALGPLLRDGKRLPDRTVFCDAGHDLAAYREDRFFRLWLPLGAPPGTPVRQGTFRWSPGQPPTLAPDEMDLARELADYRENRRKVRYHGEEISPEEAARLRALGYAVPAREPTQEKENER